jgi:RNase P/RNase MRP subunit POP5
MLNRRDKRRYLAIWIGDHSYDQRKLVEVISKRSSELFGQIATEKAKIRFIDIDEKEVIVIISCKLEMLGTMLSTIVLMQPAMVVLRISGTLKALRTRMERDSEKIFRAFL